MKPGTCVQYISYGASVSEKAYVGPKGTIVKEAVQSLSGQRSFYVHWDGKEKTEATPTLQKNLRYAMPDADVG